MTSQKTNEYIYTTYIKTTPEKLWQAITNPEFAKQYWGHTNESDWKKGSEWKHVGSTSGETHIVGKVVESAPPKRLVITWASPNNLADESRVTFEIEAMEDVARLVVTHAGLTAGSNMEKGITKGWPMVLSGMKSFLETGKGLSIIK